jgi:hypothetical protein
MLFGYGLRGGGGGRAFAAFGWLLFSASSHALATLLGVVLHVVVMLACGVLYATLVNEARETRLAWAIAIGGGIAAVLFVLARSVGGSIALVLTPANLIALGAITALTLPIGMRFAPSRA